MLKLDVDARMLLLSRRTMRARLARAGFDLVRVVRRRSPSGTGWHVWVWTLPMPRDPATIVALQLLLGSDPAREACNLRRARMLARMPVWARESWNVLYEPVQGRRKRREIVVVPSSYRKRKKQ